MPGVCKFLYEYPMYKTSCFSPERDTLFKNRSMKKDNVKCIINFYPPSSEHLASLVIFGFLTAVKLSIPVCSDDDAVSLSESF